MRKTFRSFVSVLSLSLLCGALSLAYGQEKDPLDKDPAARKEVPPPPVPPEDEAPEKLEAPKFKDSAKPTKEEIDVYINQPAYKAARTRTATRVFKTYGAINTPFWTVPAGAFVHSHPTLWWAGGLTVDDFAPSKYYYNGTEIHCGAQTMVLGNDGNVVTCASLKAGSGVGLSTWAYVTAVPIKADGTLGTPVWVPGVATPNGAYVNYVPAGVGRCLIFIHY